MKILLIDIDQHDFYPLCLTRPIADLRLGIRTIAEKWSDISGLETGFICRTPLNQKYQPVESEDYIHINARAIPHHSVWNELKNLSPEENLFCDDQWIGSRSSKSDLSIETVSASPKRKSIQAQMLTRIQDLFILCGQEINEDYKRLTEGKNSIALPEGNTLIGPKNQLFIEEGARLNACVLNTNEGPIYIAKDADIMEGSLIRGPFALGEAATVKMGAKIYGPTSIGPHCKVGGELSNVVMQAYSNKGHDGFLGNSVIGEWCNLGADSNTSNLKNNYSEVKTWSYSKMDFVNSGLTFCGLVMGDHSKCSINTMFNTGTTVGVNANIFGHGFPPKLVPSFSWGGSDGFSEFNLHKAFNIAEAMCARRGVKFTDTDRAILTNVRDSKPELKD